MIKNKKKLIYSIPFAATYFLVFSFIYLYFAGIIYGRGHYPWKPYTAAKMNPITEYLPGTKGPTLFSANCRGFRGDDPAGADFLILLLGGSTTEGLYLDNSQTWPQVMANELNKKGFFGRVVAANAAKAGLRLQHNYAQASKLLPELRQIKLVIALLGPNDLVSFLRNPYSSNSAHSMGINRVAFGSVYDSYMPWSNEFIKVEYDHFRNLFKSQILRLLFKTGIKKPRGDDFPQDKDGKTYTDRRKRRMEARKINLPEEFVPEFEKRLALYGASLKAMVDNIKHQGAVPVLLTHPINYSPCMPEEQKQLWWTGELRVRNADDGFPVFLAERAMADLLEKFNQVSRDLAAEYGAPVLLIDLAKELRGREGLYYDSWHFNIAGAKKVGEIVADAIIKNRQIWDGSSIPTAGSKFR